MCPFIFDQGKYIKDRAAVLYTTVNSGVQVFKKINFLEIRCRILTSFNIGMCTVHRLHFVCTHFG